jgi:secondary thiamine-phosphate synthase enzyme
VPHTELSVSTPAREVLVDITQRIQRALTDTWPTLDGLVSIFIPHTTAAVTINEGADPSVARDMVDGLSRFIPRDTGYRHVEGNSDAHIKASLLGSQVMIPVERGRLLLGTWQAVYLAEFDGPRTRSVWITAIAATQGDQA